MSERVEASPQDGKVHRYVQLKSEADLRKVSLSSLLKTAELAARARLK